MPALRLDGRVVRINKYDVVSQDAGVPFFVGHIGLSNEGGQELGADEVASVSMVHMMPPFLDDQRQWPVRAMGTVGLKPGEVQQIKVLCDRRLLEYRTARARRTDQYVVHPHVKRPDGEHPYHRYSCAGFVIEAYRWAGIDLVLDSAALPDVPLDTLKQAYEPFAGHLQDAGERARLGLDGDGPWPVVLAGYVMNALDRDAGQIRVEPYRPVAGDEFFPSRRDMKAESNM